MHECLIIQPIHPAGHAVLARAGIRPVAASSADPAVVLREVRTASAVITREAGLSGEAMEAAPLLRVVGLHGVGTDPIAVDAATRLGIAVINAPHSNVRSVAEHAVGLAFVLAKSVLRADHSVRTGDRSFKYTARLRELHGAVFGVVGFGNIGRATADLARAVGMRVVGYSRSQPPEILAAAGVEPLASLAEPSRRRRFRLAPSPPPPGYAQHHRRARARPDAARGVPHQHVARCPDRRGRRWSWHSATGQSPAPGSTSSQQEPLPINSPLIALDNVVLSPHVGASTQQALERTAVLTADQIVDVLAGRRPPHLVNPEVWPRIAAAAAAGGGG